MARARQRECRPDRWRGALAYCDGPHPSRRFPARSQQRRCRCCFRRGPVRLSRRGSWLAFAAASRRGREPLECADARHFTRVAWGIDRDICSGRHARDSRGCQAAPADKQGAPKGLASRCRCAGFACDVGGRGTKGGRSRSSVGFPRRQCRRRRGWIGRATSPSSARAVALRLRRCCPSDRLLVARFSLNITSSLIQARRKPARDKAAS